MEGDVRPKKLVDNCVLTGLGFDFDCDNITSNLTGTIPNGTMELAEQQINCNGLLKTDSIALLQAGNEINLTNGFQVELGAIFRAEIGDCN